MVNLVGIITGLSLLTSSPPELEHKVGLRPMLPVCNLLTPLYFKEFEPISVKEMRMKSSSLERPLFTSHYTVLDNYNFSFSYIDSQGSKPSRIKITVGNIRADGLIDPSTYREVITNNDEYSVAYYSSRKGDFNEDLFKEQLEEVFGEECPQIYV